MRDLIAIAGKQYSGKDALADYLQTLLPGYAKTPLAKAIKEEFAERYNLTPQAIEADKALYRTGLITLGQRRRQEDPYYWIKKVLAIPGPKIISDIRLKTEYDYFRMYHAFLIRLEAPREIRENRGTLSNESDPTECDLDTITAWDAVIYNDGTLEDLNRKAEELINQMAELRRRP